MDHKQPGKQAQVSESKAARASQERGGKEGMNIEARGEGEAGWERRRERYGVEVLVTRWPRESDIKAVWRAVQAAPSTPSLQASSDAQTRDNTREARALLAGLVYDVPPSWHCI